MPPSVSGRAADCAATACYYTNEVSKGAAMPPVGAPCIALFLRDTGRAQWMCALSDGSSMGGQGRYTQSQGAEAFTFEFENGRVPDAGSSLHNPSGVRSGYATRQLGDSSFVGITWDADDADRGVTGFAEGQVRCSCLAPTPLDV